MAAGRHLVQMNTRPNEYLIFIIFFSPRWIRTRHLPILPFSVTQMTNTTILSDTDDLCVDRSAITL